MDKSQARRAIAAHQAAIDRGSKKAAQHEAAIAHYRRTFGIPEPMDFGRDHEAISRRATAQREQQQKEEEFKNR